jgi:hypothetical protein
MALSTLLQKFGSKFSMTGVGPKRPKTAQSRDSVAERPVAGVGNKADFGFCLPEDRGRVGSGLGRIRRIWYALLQKLVRRLIVVEVALDWKRIDWLPSETWKKNTLPKLIGCGLRTGDLDRSVYVIRLNSDYCVEYPKGTSPTLYVGEGNFNQRINSHREWVRELKQFVGEFSFQIRIAARRRLLRRRKK